MVNDQFEQMYPDVLGAITDGVRASLGDLQLAVGIFPGRAYLNQPVEAILLVQSMVGERMKVKVSVRFPARDRKGNRVVMRLPKNHTTLQLEAGEVGALHLPITALPPTQPGPEFPVRFTVNSDAREKAKAVRPPAGGPPPSMLAISPFKLQVLQDVDYHVSAWDEAAKTLTAYFDVAAGHMPGTAEAPKIHYDRLWMFVAMGQQRGLAEQQVDEAYLVYSRLTPPAIYDALLEAVTERFALHHLALHPGEASAIAKMLTYTLDQGYSVEPNFRVEESRWFKTLCQVLVYDKEARYADPGELAVNYLFDAALYDAVILAFSIVQQRVTEVLGDVDEQHAYADRILAWLAGHGQPDLSYAYLPLVMGGLLVNQIVNAPGVNPWSMILALREAYRGRIRLVIGEGETVFDITLRLLAHCENELRRLQIEPPG